MKCWENVKCGWAGQCLEELGRTACQEARALLLTVWPQFPPMLSIVCEALTCLRFQFLTSHPSGGPPAATIHDPRGHLWVVGHPWHSRGLGLVSLGAVLPGSPKGPGQEAGAALEQAQVLLGGLA